MKGVRYINIIITILIFITLLSSLFCVSGLGESNTRAEIDENASCYIYLDIDKRYIEQELMPSETITYHIIVRNIGEDDKDITYYPPSPESLGLPLGWSAAFEPESELFVPNEGARSLLLNLSAPSDAKANTEVAMLIEGTTSKPEAQIITLELSATVSKLLSISLSSIDKITFESPNKAEELLITITNSGNGEERIGLEITNIPLGLSLSDEALDFIIGPGTKQQMTINLYPSSILTAGKYNLNISLYRVQEKTLSKEWVSSHKLILEVVYYPDLYISYGDIELSKYTIESGDDVLINITVHNLGDSDARNISLRIIPVVRSGSQLEDKIADEKISFLGLDESTTISVPWHADNTATNKLTVVVDHENNIDEQNETNNQAEMRNFYIIPPTLTRPEESNSKGAYEFTLIHLSAVAIISILAGIGVASFLMGENGKFALYSLTIPLYTRVKKGEVLNHDTRERVYEYVSEHPGEHFRAILTKLGLTNGTLIHHLHTLESQDFIKSERDGPFKRFYPSGRKLTEEVWEIVPIQRKILDAVKATPGLTQKDLSLMLHASPPTINYHVKALHGVQLLDIKRDGKNTRCFPGQSLNGWYQSSVA